MHDDFPILAAVAASPTHSFQVLEHLQDLGVKATRSTLYRRVDALIADGLLVATAVRGENGHIRRDLALTESGRSVTAASVSHVLRTEPLESPLFALALGCACVTETDGLTALLKPRMAMAARRLTMEERSLNANKDGSEYWNRVARERRIAHLQADIAWLQSLLGRRTVPQAATASDHAQPALSGRLA